LAHFRIIDCLVSTAIASEHRLDSRHLKNFPPAAKRSPFVGLQIEYSLIDLKVSARDCEQDFTASVTPQPSESSAPRLGSYGVVLMLLLLLLLAVS